VQWLVTPCLLAFNSLARLPVVRGGLEIAIGGAFGVKMMTAVLVDGDNISGTGVYVAITWLLKTMAFACDDPQYLYYLGLIIRPNCSINR
jgi:hypothetical protein